MRRKFSIFNFQFTKTRSLDQKGFSLVELLIYMGVLMVLVGILSTLLGSIFDVQLDSSSTSAVDQDSRFIQARLTYDFQYNDPVEIIDPASPGEAPQILRLKLNNDSIDTTYSVDGNGNLVLTNSQGTYNLNSSDTRVSNFSATRIGTGDNKDTVRLYFTVTSRISEANGYEARTIQTTLAGHKEN